MKKIKLESHISDLFIAFLITLTMSLIFINIDAFEMYIDFTQDHEEYELDEIILILFISSLTAIWYSIRRFKEIKRLKYFLQNRNEELVEEVVQKDELLFEQMKMALLGEMLQNIAHQWRQPLSSISTSASGLKLQKEHDLLIDDKDLYRSLDNILENSKYLSQTIDSFRNYMKENQVKKEFNLDSNIQASLEILDSTIKSSFIEIVLDLKANEDTEGFPNELMQVYINIINNAKDALEAAKIEKKYIFISSEIKDNYFHVKIKDNAKGIDQDIIKKVFEPYFTTKHKSKGTGLGLYMSYKLISEIIKGKIWVENTEFIYENEKYNGAEFNIKIPVNI